MYERISTASDAWSEAQLAEGEMKDGRWVISKFEENNLFERIGFQENDEIEAINGFPIADLNGRAGFAAYTEFKAQFESGVPVVVNLRRKGKNMQLRFQPE